MGLFRRYNKKEIIDKVENRNIIGKLILLIVGAFLSALSFNLFFVPNNFVSAGISGLAVITTKYTNIDSQLLIVIANVFLIGLSLLFLGWKKSVRTIVGTSLYMLFVILTKNFTTLLNFSLDNILMYVLAAGVVLGAGEGLVYKAGFNTGGTSIIALIIQKYTKRQTGYLLRIIGLFIIAIGGYTFGYTAVVYSLIIVVISTVLIDKVLIGISETKMFMINTEKDKEVSDFILTVISNGVTVFDSVGGYSHDKRKTLMCVVPTEKYSYLTSAIKEIDKAAFIVVSDCYEVVGGTKKKKFPF